MALNDLLLSRVLLLLLIFLTGISASLLETLVSGPLTKATCLEDSRLAAQSVTHSKAVLIGADNTSCYIFAVFPNSSLQLFPYLSANDQAILAEILLEYCKIFDNQVNVTCQSAQIQNQAQIQTLQDQQILTNQTFTLLNSNTTLPKSADKLATQAAFMGSQGAVGIEQSATITTYYSLWTEGWTVGMLCQCPYDATSATIAPETTTTSTLETEKIRAFAMIATKAVVSVTNAPIQSASSGQSSEAFNSTSTTTKASASATTTPTTITPLPPLTATTIAPSKKSTNGVKDSAFRSIIICELVVLFTYSSW